MLSDFILYFLSFNCYYFAGYVLTKTLIYANIDEEEDEKPYFNLYWNVFTRVISIYHAIIITYFAINTITSYYYFIETCRSSNCSLFYKVLNYAKYPIIPPGIEYFRRATYFMISYLITDSIYVVIMRTEKDIWGTITHHVIGGIGMFFFSYRDRFYFNGVYYMLTEVTTPFLNISWIFIHLHWNKNIIGRITLNLSGIITWILFLCVRVLGSIWLLYMIVYNINILLTYETWEIFVAVSFNPVICGLNWFWFYKLSKLIFFNNQENAKKIKIE